MIERNMYLYRHFNKNFNFLILISLSIPLLCNLPKRPTSHYELTVAGPVLFADGLGRLAIGLIDTFKHDLAINFISSRPFISLKDLPDGVKSLVTPKAKIPGNVGILFDALWMPGNHNYKVMPDCFIKLAYSMLESTAIPQEWVYILNKNFDAVIVPDSFYQTVYKKSGVTIPIFVLPHGVYIEELLGYPLKKQKNQPFVFGMSAGFWSRKNHELTIKAFAQEFGNTEKVLLKLHGRFGEESTRKSIMRTLKQYNLSNIIFINQLFNQQEYTQFMTSLDCYVFLSKGEGYSVTPREALALGIPCILSDNTAHKALCKTGFIIPVPCTLQEPAYYEVFKRYLGYNFNCTIQDVRKALRAVYENYNYYLNKARPGRTWVTQYLYKNLKPRYLQFIKPQKVLFGPENKVTNTYIMTNSQKLYRKYKQLHDFYHQQQYKKTHATQKNI